MSITKDAEERGRDSQLYAQSATLNCVLDRLCIPCLYKLFPDGKTDNLLGTVIDPTKTLCFPCNQRPEFCPRSKMSEKQGKAQIGIYDGDHAEQMLRILTVGDGDFTFSLSLANHTLKGSDTSASLTATSHEPLQSVLDTYKPHSKDTLANLKSLGATVLHGVDATSLAATAELHRTENICGGAEEKPKMKRFDYVIWNFPCLSLPAGADGQATELQANQELLSKFFSNVHPLLDKRTGEVHISHKTMEPFSWWGIKKLAADNGLEFAYAIVFDRCNYPGYTNRKALDRKSFPCNDAQIYVFVPSKRVKKMSKSSPAEGVTTTSAALSNAARCSHLPQLLESNVLVPTFSEEFVTNMRSHLLKQYAAGAKNIDGSSEPAQKKHKKF